jgi:hypothetical protein
MIIRRTRQPSVVTLACLLVSALSICDGAQAQSPQWQVIVTPTLNPLPIGLCGAVHVTVLDAAAMDMPRNGLGARVTIADFDMTVTAPGARSVVGQQIDASHWSVCACNGAPVGGVATVTATYPARALPATARVPGASFTSKATVFIAAAKGTNPPPCLATPPAPAAAARNATAANAPASAPSTAPSTGAPNNSKSAATSSPAQKSSPNSQPANAPPSPPGVPAQIPNFPASAADWAALQKALGSKGWAELQKEMNAAMDETPDNTDDKPPPGVPKEMMGAGRNHAAAVAAFKKLAPVLRHDRCANCHTNITYWDDPGEDGDPPRPATHKGGDINELPPTAKNGFGQPDLKFTPCQDCHTKAPQAWANSGPDWTGLDDYQLCQKLKQAMFNGEVLLDHLRTDDLIKLAFQGQRAMDLTPKPPPLSHAQFMQYATEWINRMDAMKKFPKARSEGCPRNDSWSGAIEYTYTEVTKLNRYESHGAVHIVGGLAKWSALAARTEDHSAKNCPSIFSASSAGGGEMQLVTIDYTSEKGVSGFAMPIMNAKAGAKAPDSFVGLTIFPGKYGLSIDLPMKGSGRYQGGGPACPGYRSFTQTFDAKIGQGADGIFDPDNPDEISGTKTESPFPGATFTMKWQFMRLNEDWSR